MGVTYATVGRYETGQMSITLDMIDKACAAMGITRAQYFAGPPPEPTPPAGKVPSEK
jgi:transcriptional regulator with XRE-family HTH domain